MTTRLKADEAVDIVDSKNYAFKKTMSVIRSMIDMEIRNASRLGKRTITYRVPRNVFGHEWFDVNKMGWSIAQQLFEDKFNVSGTCESLVISWGGKDPAITPPSQPIKQPVKVSRPCIHIPVPRKK